MKKLWILVACVLLMTVITLPVLAEEDEDEYYITGSVFTIGGGTSSSENFGVQATVGLTAIGGSSSEQFHMESGSPEYDSLNNPPIADAGRRRSVAIGETIRLSGAAQDSDGDILIYFPWVQEPSLGTLDYDQGFKNPTYTAGNVTGVVELTFRVSDGILEDADTTTVSIYDPSQGCFIATAAYGTRTAEQIDVLREFRDVVLLESAAGSQFVALYYQLSPPVADFIARNELLRILVRELLVNPIVWMVEATGDMWRMP